MSTNSQKTVVIVHGWTGSAGREWLPWLAGRLRSAGYRVVVPNMPVTYIPIPSVWTAYLKHAVGRVDSNTYFVGHSVGCQAILRMMAKRRHPCGGAVFVAGWFVASDFLKKLPPRSLFRRLDAVLGPVFRVFVSRWEVPFAYERLSAAIPKSVAIFSENDWFVDAATNIPLFRERVGSDTVVIPGTGHFTTRDGYREFPELLRIVLALTH